jgi:hypothetical protein
MQSLLVRLVLSVSMLGTPMSGALAQTPVHERARTLIGQGNQRGAIAALAPLMGQGCDATAHYLAAAAYSKLGQYLGTMRAVAKALECRPSLTPERARGAARLMGWAVGEFERNRVRSVRGTVSKPGGDTDSFALRAEADRDRWRLTIEQLRTRFPGTNFPTGAAACAASPDPLNCSAAPAPTVALGDGPRPQ